MQVDYIEPDKMVSGASITQQNSATWGLSRISHRRKGYPEYVYDDSAGRGVCAYVIDSGIDDSHPVSVLTGVMYIDRLD